MPVTLILLWHNILNSLHFDDPDKLKTTNGTFENRQEDDDVLSLSMLFKGGQGGEFVKDKHVNLMSPPHYHK